MSLIGAVRAAEAHERWGVLVLEGLVGIAAAAVTVLWPAITTIALVFVIAAWAVITGALEIGAAIHLRKVISREWLLIVGGIASILFGLLLVMVPVIGAVVIALWVGAYAFIFGVAPGRAGFQAAFVGPRSHGRRGAAAPGALIRRGPKVENNITIAP